jgi:hypothetical protein
MRLRETDWNLDAREPADWDEGLAPFVAAFAGCLGRGCYR